MKILTPSLRIGKSIKRVSLTRYLISKFAYEPKKVEGRDVLALYTNQLWLEEQCLRDKQFASEFNEMVGPLGQILTSVSLTSRASAMVFSKTVASKLEAYLVPVRNYPQWKSRFAGSYEYVSPKPLGVSTKVLPPERYIGIGYRDKGSRRDPALDGSPSWQDVATAAANLERIENETEREKFKREVEACETVPEIIGIIRKYFDGRDDGTVQKAPSPSGKDSTLSEE